MATTTTVTGANSLSADFLASVNPKTSDRSVIGMAEDRFLKLLTTQLKNQDPLNPLDNAEMTSQMAQISTVNGIEKLNATLERMMTNSTDAQTMQAAAMLGHQVMVAGNGMTLAAGGQSIGGVEFAQPVDSATVTIKDGNGLVIRTLKLGANSAGLTSIGWDGKNDAGVEAAAGRYSFSVGAELGGKSVSATTLELAPVTGVLRDKMGVRLELGQLGDFALADIRQIY